MVIWRSGTALTMALGLWASAISPYVFLGIFPRVAAAQFQRQDDRSGVVIPEGTLISVRHREADKIIVAPDETLPLTLIVDRDITSVLGTVLISRDSEVVGQLQPSNGGSQFVADELLLPSGDSLRLDATSETVTETEEMSRGSRSQGILKGALIGAVAASVLSEIFGDIQLLEVLLGAGVGGAAGAVLDDNKAEVVVIYPDTDLTLTLQSDLVLR
ncbi:MAG: hypothetical protein WBB29_04715 [Geitlerinemataceae cyanobacterium]